MRMHGQFGAFRNFVGTVDPGNVLQFTAPRLDLESLGVAAFTFRERRIDKDFEKLAGRKGSCAERASLSTSSNCQNMLRGPSFADSLISWPQSPASLCAPGYRYKSSD